MQVRGSLSHRHAGCDMRAQEKWQCLRSPCQFSFPVRGGGPAVGPGPSCCCCRHCEPRASTHLSGGWPGGRGTRDSQERAARGRGRTRARRSRTPGLAWLSVLPTRVVQELVTKKCRATQSLGGCYLGAHPEPSSLEVVSGPRRHTHPQMALTAEIRTDGGCVS